MIDAHSKWIKAVCTPSTSSASVIEVMRTLFAQFGVPEMIVTDNGTGFVSSNFEQFLKSNGVKHATSAPYHPASNGLAERAVQIVKKGLKKLTTGTMSFRLAKVLFNYRIVPQTTTGVSPAELLLGRRPRTCLDLLRPNAAERVEERQQKQKAQHDHRARSRTFRVGDAIFLKNFGAGQRWLPGQIVEMTGPVSFQVLLEDGRRKRCHQDQLQSGVVEDGHPDMSQGSSEVDFPFTNPSFGEENLPLSVSTEPPASRQPDDSFASMSSPTKSNAHAHPSEANTQRCPRRQRKQREWFEPGTN